METKSYNPVTFFRNVKEYGVREALEKDAFRTIENVGRLVNSRAGCLVAPVIIPLAILRGYLMFKSRRWHLCKRGK